MSCLDNPIIVTTWEKVVHFVKCRIACLGLPAPKPIYCQAAVLLNISRSFLPGSRDYVKLFRILSARTTSIVYSPNKSRETVLELFIFSALVVSGEWRPHGMDFVRRD